MLLNGWDQPIVARFSKVIWNNEKRGWTKVNDFVSAPFHLDTFYDAKFI